MAGEEAGHAARHNEILNEILPQALLHWPQVNARQYDHTEQRTRVRDLFIRQAFARAVNGGNRTNNQYCYEANGLAPKWVLKYQAEPEEVAHLVMSSGERELPFNETERTVLAQLITERDKDVHCFFDPYDRLSLAKDFRLLHLRWMLNLEGYEAHWNALNREVTDHPAERFEENILRTDQLSQLWQVHACMNGGESAVLSTLAHWQSKSAASSDDRRMATIVHQYALLFQHQFARGHFSSCTEISRLVKALAVRDGNGRVGLHGRARHPNREDTSMPIHSALYWHYLDALSTVKAIQGGEDVNDVSIALLRDAESLATAFQNTQECFWTIHEAFEGGGGEDYEGAPYDVDLRDTEPWRLAIEALLARAPSSGRSDELAALAMRLAAADRPFAPGHPEFDMSTTDMSEGGPSAATDQQPKPLDKRSTD